jgi:hypothetical protein
MYAVYYSLVFTAERTTYENQWIRSVESLRKFNKTIPVYLFLFAEPTAGLINKARECDIIVRQLGGYRDCLREIAGEEGTILSSIPTLNKLLPLGSFPPTISQLLFLDCDTFFFGDVASIFLKYQQCKLYAREEPHSRRSRFLEYRPSCVDEDVLYRIAAETGSSPVPPYNSGVFLMNHGLDRQLYALREEFLDYAWRLTAGASLSPEINIPPGLKSKIAAFRNTRLSEIEFPSRNYWILEQIALWLTLGMVNDLTHSAFPMEDVLQNGEFRIYSAYRNKCTILHYFRGNEALFLKE